MTFERKLFEQVREAIPNTTAKTFSRDCGRSVGYYGSITAQKLSITTNALICLAEVMECRKELMRDMTPRKLAKIEEVQQMIAAEIASRIQHMDCENMVVRKMIISAVAKAVAASEQQHYPPHFHFVMQRIIRWQKEVVHCKNRSYYACPLN